MRTLAAMAGLLAAGAALFAYLLIRFPYDGLYGQDAYAYYYQALALWREIRGLPSAPGALFDAHALRWPLGYHLQLILGYLLSGDAAGGRALTLLLAWLAPALLYLIIREILRDAPPGRQVIAGLIGGGALLLTGTYARMGLSLMADVPALFWSLLAVYCALRAWPPPARDESRAVASHPGWAAATGVALGLAVLVRYGSVLLGAALLVYLLLRAYPPGGPRTLRSLPWRGLAAAGLGFAVTLLPELAYALTHPGGLGYGIWLSDWRLDNLFSRTLTSADGVATFPQPPIAFYLLSPLTDAPAGFLSILALPAAILGLGVLLRDRRRAVAGLLLTWWLVPALFFSGSPYEAHRFVLAYLPALTTLAGIGGAVAVIWVGAAVRRPRVARTMAGGVLAGLVLLGMAGGALQTARSVRDWVAFHAAAKTEERGVIALARAAAGPGGTVAPRVVCFGATAALYHYTGWPVLELYNADTPEIAEFLAAPGPRLVVLPEASMATQWAGTPLAARWDWLRTHYTLTRQGTFGSYTVYTLTGGP
ncbi:MAG TPA: phospholipid carrier-dependent glycosyltransferase [Chloroflexia bacterium]